MWDWDCPICHRFPCVCGEDEDLDDEDDEDEGADDGE